LPALGKGVTQQISSTRFHSGTPTKSAAVLVILQRKLHDTEFAFPSRVSTNLCCRSRDRSISARGRWRILQRKTGSAGHQRSQLCQPERDAGQRHREIPWQPRRAPVEADHRTLIDRGRRETALRPTAFVGYAGAQKGNYSASRHFWPISARVRSNS